MKLSSTSSPISPTACWGGLGRLAWSLGFRNDP